jgi:hypothetical protein
MVRSQRYVRAAIVIAIAVLVAAWLPEVLLQAQAGLPVGHALHSFVGWWVADIPTLTMAIIASGIGGAICFLKSDRHDVPTRDNLLDRPLVYFSKEAVWTIRHALEGLLIVGGTGSSKTSGSARTALLAMLSEGWGGIVLTVKKDERQRIVDYCNQTGRCKDLVVIDASCKYRLNPLHSEVKRKGEGAGLVLNIVHLLMSILDVADPQQGEGGKSDDASYFRKATAQLIRNAIELLLAAGEALEVYNIYRIVISAPQSREEARSEEWRESSYCYHCFQEAKNRCKDERAAHDLELVADFFVTELASLGEKTRACIVSTFSSTIDLLHRGLLKNLLCTDSNIDLQDCERGTIFLIEFPVKEFKIVGKIIQIVFKLCFQACVERRDIKTSPQPVFFYSDEYQNFVTSDDPQFFATCRSARVANVVVTQNLGGLEAALGGGTKGEAETKALTGNLNTKVFHANSDTQTNSWAAELCGKSEQILCSNSTSRSDELNLVSISGGDNARQRTSGMSESMDYRVQPSEFSRFRTGGPANDGWIDAILFQNGQRFPSTDGSFTPITFRHSQ